MAKNLCGYYVQAGGFNAPGAYGSPVDEMEAGGGFLFFPWCYPGSITLNFRSSFDWFNDGKKCYVGLDVNGNVSMSAIRSYMGPMLFAVGMQELPIPAGWYNEVAQWRASNGIVYPGPVLGGAAAHCNILYCAVGELAPGGGVVSTLPADGFCCNYNQGYGRLDLFSMYDIFASYVKNFTYHKSNGKQYKFNGRHISTGGAVGGSGGAYGAPVNIVNGLTMYGGYKPWATGWLYWGDSVYKFLYDENTVFPSCFSGGLPAYSQNVNISPELVMYYPYSLGGLVPEVPSVATTTIFGYNASNSVVRLSFNTLANEYKMSGCSVFDNSSVMGHDMFNTMYFGGASYPSGGGPFIPTCGIGIMFTPEAVTLNA